MVYKVLVLEDNELLLETYEDFLSQYGCEVILAKNIEIAYEICFENRFDIYLIDVKLPTSNGFEFLRSLRDSGDKTPAIFITSFTDKQSLLEGFKSGADDYIKKPFDLDELWFRIEAIISRDRGYNDRVMVINDEYSLNVDRKNLTCNGNEVLINLKDFELLHLLLTNRTQVVTKEMIEEKLWCTNDNSNSGSIRVYVNNLKKILGKDSISNIRGIGYRLEI
ncbi:response regulator transcription factor [Sulfurospirillum arcachonense]|uniref:response regulator transcription factor n=1 Tax=Sulfurospirillum arcachonense TaxID=57666 RepID=UPI0004686FF9|nr:response regulator transcription factor [Sulfurospirillum arcachonense]